MDAEAVLLEAEKRPDLLQFQPQRSVRIWTVLYGDQPGLKSTRGKGIKGQDYQPKRWSQGILEVPNCVSSPMAHCSLPSLKLERNGRRVQQSFDGTVLLLPQGWTTHHQLVATRLAAAISKGWVSKYWWTRACLCTGSYSRSCSPCQGKQRSPTNGLAPVYSNPPDFLGSRKLSSCWRDPEDVWPTCLFINFFQCFVTANRCNAFLWKKSKKKSTLGQCSSWIYKNLLWFGGLDVP